MNTISNFQIFSPMPFRQYNPKITGINILDVNKNTGHFDREEYKFISFYGKDYVSGEYNGERKTLNNMTSHLTARFTDI